MYRDTYHIVTYCIVLALFIGSLNWALGLIPPGCLHLRLLQRRFHAIDLLDQFIPMHRSDQSVLANLLWHLEDLSFLTYGTHMGDSQISSIWTYSDHKLHISCVELEAVILALHHWVTVLQGQ